MKEKTKEWIKYANSDFGAAEELIKNNDYNNIVLFHCQQAIEKLIKAIYDELDLKVYKIHSVVKLYSLLPDEVQAVLKLKDSEMDILDIVYIDSRYPSEIGILPTGYPSNEKTKYIFELSKNFFSKILEYLKTNRS